MNQPIHNRGGILTKRVKKGMALLDKLEPNWEKRIDLQKLELSSCHHCILGQVFGSYPSEEKTGLDRCDEREAHGFVVLSLIATEADGYDLLTNIWKEQIMIRCRGARK